MNENIPRQMVAAVRIHGRQANVYEVPGDPENTSPRITNYFCCEFCGACSGHQFHIDPVVKAAVDHLTTHHIQED